MREIPKVWMQTASGKAWDMLHPLPEDVDWRDIAYHLAKICRFNGATLSHYSVAQHSIIVARQLPPEWRLYGLLHDAHEFAFGDMTQPVKLALSIFKHERGNGMSAYEVLEARAAHAIHRAAGLFFPLVDEIEDAVKRADMVALATEARDLLAPSSIPWGLIHKPLTRPIIPWSWPKAEQEFLAALDHMLPAGAGGVR